MLPCGRLLISGRVERPLKCPNQAEVQDLHGPVEGQEDVVRLHIAVHDAARVRGRQPLGDGGPDLEGSPERERSANERHAQRFALEELRDGVRNAPLVADVVDRQDIRMRKSGDRPGLALEPGERLGILFESLRQNLDSDIAAEPGILRPVHLPHSSRAQGRQDLVGAEARSSRDRHRICPDSTLAGPLLRDEPRLSQQVREAGVVPQVVVQYRVRD